MPRADKTKDGGGHPTLLNITNTQSLRLSGVFATLSCSRSGSSLLYITSGHPAVIKESCTSQTSYCAITENITSEKG